MYLLYRMYLQLFIKPVKHSFRSFEQITQISRIKGSYHIRRNKFIRSVTGSSDGFYVSKLRITEYIKRRIPTLHNHQAILYHHIRRSRFKNKRIRFHYMVSLQFHHFTEGVLIFQKDFAFFQWRKCYYLFFHNTIGSRCFLRFCRIVLFSAASCQA